MITLGDPSGLSCRQCKKVLHVTKDEELRPSRDARRTTFATVSGRQMAITLCQKHCDPDPNTLSALWHEIRERQITQPEGIATPAQREEHLRFIGDPPLGVLAIQSWQTLLPR